MHGAGLQGGPYQQQRSRMIRDLEILEPFSGCTMRANMLPSMHKVVRALALFLSIASAASNDLISVLRGTLDVTAAVGYLQSRTELVNKLNAGNFTGIGDRAIARGSADDSQCSYPTMRPSAKAL
jgi:hypothetical protein